MKEIHQIFPQPVYLSKLERELTNNELKIIHKFRKDTLPLRSTSSPRKIVNHSLQTSRDHYVLDNKGLRNLKKGLYKIVLDYFDQVICTSNFITPYITQSWLNYAESNQFLQRHAHQNSFVSGVFYVAADKEVDKIHFFKVAYESLMLEYDKFNVFNSTSWKFPVETGTIILFPSSLAHGMENKVGNNLRISLAFNVFLRGHIGNDEKIMQLELR